MFLWRVSSVFPDAMQLNMRRLHSRGAANRGICVDAEGAMLGPDCVLVRRTSRGFRSIKREHAAALQKCALAEGPDRDLLFRQSQRITEALDKGELALAQIYGLHIPVIDLDDRRLARIAQIGFAKGYDPDEPRVPKGNLHGGEWTTGEASDAATSSNIDVAADSSDGGALAIATASDDGSDGGDDGEGDADRGGSGDGSPATGQGPSGSPEASAASGDQANGGGTAPPDNSIQIKWPDTSPSAGAPPPRPSNPDIGPGTLGSPDLGDGEANTAPSPAVAQPAPSDSAATPPGSDTGGVPSPDIPAKQPSTTPEINAVLRSLATWLARAMAMLGALYEFDPEVAAVLAAIEATVWLADYSPKIFSYLDDPKTLAELQRAATRPAPAGYEIHHIVEAQKRSDNPESNARNFPDLIDSAENLVRVPYWKHVEISSWYSTVNEDYNGLSPRDYLRGKGWEEQYEIGLRALRRFGVLK
jgi:hypothetical protein